MWLISQDSDQKIGRPPGQRWILGQGLRVGGPGKPPFWRTLKEFCKGLGSVALKSKQSTHTGATGNITIGKPDLGGGWEVRCGWSLPSKIVCSLRMYRKFSEGVSQSPSRSIETARPRWTGAGGVGLFLLIPTRIGGSNAIVAVEETRSTIANGALPASWSGFPHVYGLSV